MPLWLSPARGRSAAEDEPEVPAHRRAARDGLADPNLGSPSWHQAAASHPRACIEPWQRPPWSVVAGNALAWPVADSSGEGGGPTGVERDSFILSPESAIGARALALFGIVMTAFELALLGRVIFGGTAAVLFIASFWITEAHIALGARALLVLVGAGAIIFARLRGADWLG
ncbi:MAG: hypothetical protein L6Q84_09315 [Polyangiaceae bacterium]|nr:hypothetical protein [Polyangiaceae bacterium]